METNQTVTPAQPVIELSAEARARLADVYLLLLDVVREHEAQEQKQNAREPERTEGAVLVGVHHPA